MSGLLEDVMLVAGVLLLGSALWLAFGLAAVLGFLGALLLVVGGLVAYQRGRAGR